MRPPLPPTRRFLIVSTLLAGGVCAEVKESVGQIGNPVEWIKDPNPPADDSKREFAAQRTTNGCLVLTASNGFFDRGVKARGTSAPPDAAGPSYIAKDFGWLESWSKPDSTLRWHLWIEKPGRLEASVVLAGEGTAGSGIVMGVGGREKPFSPRAGGAPVRLSFEVGKPGWVPVKLRLARLAGSDAGRFQRIDLSGPAAERAAVLRARWRPAACHARFSSSEVANPVAWVMSTRSSPAAMVPSYSPVTTPFGYYGCTIDGDGSFSGSANFSMWSFGKGKPSPQERWSHLLAVGSPVAEFGSFGHEGSGVKVRGEWRPFGSGAKEITLALRAEVHGDQTRWFGYYLDAASKRFKLYAAGASFNGKKRPPSLNPGAFVEQPGPPEVERSGDLVRDVQRRGWMLDGAGRWHWIDTMSRGKGPPTNQHWSVSKDGWFSMGMGGMAHRANPGGAVKLDTSGLRLPDWLDSSTAAQLSKLPAVIGPRTILTKPDGTRSVEFELGGMDLAPGETATVTAFHGPVDCLTFDHDLNYSETRTRFWPSRTKAQAAHDGSNSVTLPAATEGETTCVRLLVETPRGRIWSMETDKAAPIR